MLKRMSKHGFSIVAVIAVIAIVTGIVIGGWYVWQSRQEKQKNNQTSKDTSSARLETENSDEMSTAEGSKYLIIDEWDLRITLPEGLRGDISYFINDRAERDFGGPVLVDFTSKKFSAGSLKCSEIEELPRSLVSIMGYKDGEGGEPLETQPFKRIGDTKYYFVKTVCEDDIEREGSTEDKQLLVDLKKTIQDTLDNH